MSTAYPTPSKCRKCGAPVLADVRFCLSCASLVCANPNLPEHERAAIIAEMYDGD